MTNKISLGLFSFLMLVTIQSLFGQSNKLDPKTSTFIDNAMIECIYNYTINAPLKDSIDQKGEETYKTILQANSSVSKFWDWHSFKKDSISYFSKEEISKDSISELARKYHMKVKCLFEPVIVKNYPNEKITVTDILFPEEYIYTEEKINRNWKLQDDTLTVCGYLCNKAVCDFGGRIWVAWYASEISISDGPWKLYGLPGLILKAEDTTTTHCFEAVAIRNSDRPIYLEKNILRVKIKKDRLIKSKNKFEEDPKKNMVRPPNAKQITVYKGSGIIKIDGRRFSVNLKTKYSPLELK
jgi:GLPGLI family protein